MPAEGGRAESALDAVPLLLAVVSRRPPINDRIAAVLLKAYSELGTIKRVAEAFGYDKNAVRKAVRRLGVKSRIVSDAEAAEIWATYQRLGSITAAAELHGRNINTVSKILARFGYRDRKVNPRLGGTFVEQLYAEYTAGFSLNALAKKYGRTRNCLREIFDRRGLPLRVVCRRPAFDPKTGRILPARRMTPAQIDELIAAATKIRIPDALRLEWRTWSMDRRREFIARLRAKLRSPRDRPDKPFSSNVEPFEYGSPRAHQFAAEMNAGLGSHEARVKMDLVSQGVIWRDRLYFWSPEGKTTGTGAYYIGPWRPGTGRPALHRIMWEEIHGRKVPEGMVVRFADGNPNNFEPENLILRSRNDVARENQAAALGQRSREKTALLLSRAQRNLKGDKANDLLATLNAR